MILWINKITAEYVPDINEEEKYEDLKFFDKNVTNLSAKESFINEDEKEKILKKVKEYVPQFEEIGPK